MIRRRLAPIALTALALAGTLSACARSEEASQVPTDNQLGYNMIGRVQMGGDDDGEPALGDWRQALQQERPALEFGPMGTDPQFSLLCAPSAGSIVLQRHGGAPTGPLPRMRVTIGEASEDLAVELGGGTIPMLRATVPLTSPVGQALTGTAQPIQVRLTDGTPLLLPGSALVGDYARSCFRSGGGAIGNSAAPANGTVPMPPPPVGNSAAPRR